MTGKRQPRRRFQVIPATELAWEMPSGPNDTEYSEEQKHRHNYEKRQRVFDVVNVKPELRRVEEYETMLEDVRMEETSEKMPSSDPNATYRSRVLPYGATIISDEYRSSGPSDKEQLGKIQSRLEDLVGGFKTSDWMKDAVMYPLEPHQIRKAHYLGSSKLFKELGEHQLLINNATATAFLAVKTSDARRIERLLGPSETDEVTISEPGSGFGIRLRNGEDPAFLKDCRETKIALIFDDNYVRYVEGMEARRNYQHPIVSSQEFYEDFFRCWISSSRLLSDPEKRLIESRLSRNDIRSRPVRLLEFQTSHQRNLAAKHSIIEIIECFYCDGQFGYRTHFESLELSIKYDMKPKIIESVAVTLTCEQNKKMAKEAFFKNFLQSTFLDEDTRTKNEDMRFKRECKRESVKRTEDWESRELGSEVFGQYRDIKNTESHFFQLVVYDFPRHMPKYEPREWLVRRILATNGIEVEKFEKFVEQEDEATNSHLTAKQTDVRKTIDFELWRTGQRQRTWNVSRKNQGVIREVEEYEVQFANVTSGTHMITRILQKADIEAVFTVDKTDELGPELRPCYTRTFAISRRLRAVFSKAIQNFDMETRRFFTDLTAAENETMMTAESTYYRARVHEEWKTGSDAGVIGIMGWPVESVKHFTKELEKVLQPKLFEQCPHFLSGAGEVYAKSLEKKYEGALVVEVDKFSSHLKLFGDAANLAIEDLKVYLQNRGRIGMNTEIPLHFPFINSRVSNALNGKVVQDLRKAMGISYLGYDWRHKVLEFEGTVEQYEELMAMMEELSRKCFEEETCGRTEKDMPSQECPICMCEVDDEYYRFQCGHALCRGCANNKVGSIEASKMPIKCDHTGCEKNVAPSDILNIILGDQDRIRDMDTAKLHPFYIQCMQSALNCNPDAIECRTTDCPGLLSKSKGDLLKYKKCTSCPRRYCRQCLFEPHKGQTCEEYREIRRVDGSLIAFMEEAGDTVKKCPGCNVPVEKAVGCNHIECKCGCHFCWLCLEPSTREDIYTHMNEVHGNIGLNEDPALHAGEDLHRQQEILDQHNPRRAQAEQNPMEHANIPQRPPRLVELPPALTEFLGDVPITEEDRQFTLLILNSQRTVADRDAVIAGTIRRLTQN